MSAVPQREARMAAVSALIEQGLHEEAAVACAALADARPHDAGVALWASQAYQRLGLFERMVDAARDAWRLAPGDPQARRRVVESAIYMGRIDAARECLAEQERQCAEDAHALLGIAEMHLHCEGHVDAHRCFERALRLAPDDAQALHGVASTATSLGQIDLAEALYERLLAAHPTDGDAWVNRSSLRTWSARSHHLGPLAHALAALPADHPACAALHYAMGKELEDLGEPARAFDHFRAGAAVRRARMRYRVEGDEETMRRIAQAFDAATLARRAAAAPAPGEPSVFVLGLPRSGTTLVDRVLGSHPAVSSLGEVNTLVFALMRLAGGNGGKLDLVQRSTRIDAAQLGDAYRAGAASYGHAGPRLSNKTPSNFLYLGLIHQALPGATVFHVRRHPLDSCFAMFKTLFRMGYPFSYDLDDLARYYVAYDRLMGHWRREIPGTFLDIDYETMVADQTGTTGRLLAHAGLPFDAACLSFHANPHPTATASAVQVRRPLYASSVGRWRDHRAALAPLARHLEAHGIACD